MVDLDELEQPAGPGIGPLRGREGREKMASETATFMSWWDAHMREKYGRPSMEAQEAWDKSSEVWRARGRTEAVAEIRALRAERDALQRFKDFVHRRLDTAGVPTHPDGPHSKEGCRIGDRLDLVVGERDAALARVVECEKALELVLMFHGAGPWDPDKSLRWQELSGSPEATTKVLCDAVRQALRTPTPTEARGE
jgi:hypothetical protein